MGEPKKLRLVSQPPEPQDLRISLTHIHYGDALSAYDEWLPPACIISDGPYGLGKFPGEATNPGKLAEWYAPHAAAWARRALPGTTLWFWNSEIGWAKAHRALELHGWQYEEAVGWNKGISHLAGNCNSKTIRGVPVVTELAVRYTRRVTLPREDGVPVALKEWVRAEWQRSGLPMSQSNQACNVANAATRKYLTQCDLWYFPPGEAIVGMAEWCARFGRAAKRPYFSLDGINPPTADAWERMRSRWKHTHGVTNVWNEPPVHGPERVKVLGSASLHANQKPLRLMERQILAVTDPGDVVWEPFGGLCSESVAAVRQGRIAQAAEISADFFKVGRERVEAEAAKLPLPAASAA